MFNSVITWSIFIITSSSSPPTSAAVNESADQVPESTRNITWFDSILWHTNITWFTNNTTWLRYVNWHQRVPGTNDTIIRPTLYLPSANDSSIDDAEFPADRVNRSLSPAGGKQFNRTTSKVLDFLTGTKTPSVPHEENCTSKFQTTTVANRSPNTTPLNATLLNITWPGYIVAYIDATTKLSNRSSVTPSTTANETAEVAIDFSSTSIRMSTLTGNSSGTVASASQSNDSDSERRRKLDDATTSSDLPSGYGNYSEQVGNERLTELNVFLLDGNDFDSVLDSALMEVSEELRNAGETEIAIPDFSRDFEIDGYWSIKGRFEGSGGNFSDISSIRRTGPCSLTQQSEDSVSFNVSLGFGTFRIYYGRFNLTVLNVKFDGEIAVEIKSNSLTMVATGRENDDGSFSLILDAVELHQFGGFRTHSSVLGAMKSRVVDLLANSLLNYFEERTKHQMEVELYNRFGKYFNEKTFCRF